MIKSCENEALTFVCESEPDCSKSGSLVERVTFPLKTPIPEVVEYMPDGRD